MQEKVLPDSNKIIVKEDILRRFGVTSSKTLFPVPALWHKTENIIYRKQYDELNSNIRMHQHQ